MASQEQRRSDPTRQGVGLRLKAAREGKQLTQDQVARIFDVTKGTVSAWETGGGDPGVYRLRELSKLYCVSTDSLLWEDGLTNEAMQFAAQFDALSEKQRITFRALWLAYVQTALDDNGVETRMPITKTEKEPRP